MRYLYAAFIGRGFSGATLAYNFWLILGNPACHQRLVKSGRHSSEERRRSATPCPASTSISSVHVCVSSDVRATPGAFRRLPLKPRHHGRTTGWLHGQPSLAEGPSLGRLASVSRECRLPGPHRRTPADGQREDLRHARKSDRQFEQRQHWRLLARLQVNVRSEC